MRKLATLSALLLLGTLCAACGDDDDPSGLPPDTDLQVLARCAGIGVLHLGLAVETSLVLFHELDDPAYAPPAEFTYSPNTGDFGYTFDLGLEPGATTVIDGTVATLETVGDGLDEGDIFTVTWAIRTGAGDDDAGGAFRVIHNGTTTQPPVTETMRIIPAGNIWVGDVGGCHTEFTQLELTVHHLRPEGEELRIVSVGFETTDSPGTLLGYFSASAGMDMVSFQGTYMGTTYTCTLDLDTYEVDCAAG